ncbi:hypothetical protein [Candidatus Electronema sp. TJ]|uniref:hypothetical protein n=1 Tax=Candidatus Electronema sp. TJ TaxID=3401573 RepID=UPI003AA93920
MIIFSRSTTARAERGLFSFIFLLIFCTASSAAAGYGTDDGGGIVREGGGTWGSILEMSAEVNGPDIVFNVRRQDRMPMYPESRISIRTGSWRGGDAASGTVSSGSRSITLTVRTEGGKAQSYYACISNSYGHAWVGPLKIDGYDDEKPREYETYRSDYPDYSNEGGGVGRPRIDSWPSSAWLDEPVSIAVTAGLCRNGSMVRLRCMAEDSDRPRSRPYESGWIRTGDIVKVPFRFDSPGKKRISCVTLDSCCTSPQVSRPILVKERNRPPFEPRISSKPAEIKLKVPVHIPVLPGSDPDGDQVKVECRAEDARTFSSGWFNSLRWTDAIFTFDQPGSKRISCVTIDRRGAVSCKAERVIDVVEAIPVSSTGETRINISVVTKPDGTADSKVSVESSRSEGCAPFCDGDITYDKPYLPAPYQDRPEQHFIYEP